MSWRELKVGKRELVRPNRHDHAVKCAEGTNVPRARARTTGTRRCRIA